MTKCKSCHAMKNNSSHLCSICFDQLRHFFGGKNHGGRHYCPSCGYFFFCQYLLCIPSILSAFFLRKRKFLMKKKKCALCSKFRQTEPAMFYDYEGLTVCSSCAGIMLKKETSLSFCPWCPCHRKANDLLSSIQRM